jgi:hypothetical protein
MKKVILLLAVAMCSLLSYSQTNLMVWNNGRMQYAQPIVNVDSLTFPDRVSESDTLHFILPRSIVRTVYETITIEKHDTLYLKPDAITITMVSAFSVAADKQVCFSKGNLQYTQSTKKWEFANEQYEMIGEANVSNGALADKIDLFGWSADNTTAQWGISTSADNADYSGDFVDWGKNIGDGNTWRTLTQEEWTYLLKTRTGASSKYGVARINLNADGSQYTNGIIVLPDSWTCPSGITFKSGTTSGYGEQYYANHQTFTLSQWQQLEQAGAVFLPAVGYRFGTSMGSVQAVGYYWTSVANGTDYANDVRITSGTCFIGNYDRNHGHAVRLVKDVK